MNEQKEAGIFSDVLDSIWQIADAENYSIMLKEDLMDLRDEVQRLLDEVVEQQAT